jgi:hypothetical protein
LEVVVLDIQNQKHFNKVKAFAESIGCMEQLQSKLDYLDTYGDQVGGTKCVLSYDFAPHSFSFLMMRKDDSGEYQPWFNGGLIFHNNVWGVHT